MEKQAKLFTHTQIDYQSVFRRLHIPPIKPIHLELVSDLLAKNASQ